MQGLGSGQCGGGFGLTSHAINVLGNQLPAAVPDRIDAGVVLFAVRAVGLLVVAPELVVALVAPEADLCDLFGCCGNCLAHFPFP